MKIVITPETDEERRKMPEEGTTFEGVPRMVLIMGGSDSWFSLTGPIDVLRADVSRMDHQLNNMATVVCVKQAMAQLATEAQIANGTAAKIGQRIIRTGR